MSVPGLADQKEAEGKGLLVRELGVIAISYGGADWTPLLREICPALVLGESIHWVPSFEEAPAIATLVHEVVGQASLLAFTDGPSAFCAECAADWFAGEAGLAPGRCFA